MPCATCCNWRWQSTSRIIVDILNFKMSLRLLESTETGERRPAPVVIQASFTALRFETAICTFPLRRTLAWRAQR